MTDKLLRSLTDPPADADSREKVHVPGKEIKIANECGNTVLRIQFPDFGNWKRLTRATTHNHDPASAFGIQYNFQLYDSGEDAAVNAPEW
jgi:hypothetical protein